MAIRGKAFTALAFALINFFGSLVLTINVDQRFMWPTILLPVAAGLYLLSLLCERCGTSICKGQIDFAGIEITTWGWIWVPKSCSNCGKRFDANH